MKKLFKNFIFLPLIVIAAIGFVVFQVKNKAPVEHVETSYPVKSVEVITAGELPFRARAMAFGNVEPAVTVNAKSEVSGKIVYIHPDLRKGSSVSKDTVVMKIEPTSFEFSLSQSQAGLEGSRSSLAQLEAEEQNTLLGLAIAKDNLRVGQQELERTKALQEKNLVARSSFDKEFQKVLSLRQQVQDIEGNLASFASRKAATEAQILQSRSQVDQSIDTLGRTEIRLPFDARIGSVSVEKGEFTPAGADLFEALGMQAVEINAQLPLQQFRPLVAGLRDTDNANFPGLDLQNSTNLQVALSSMRLEARVRLVGTSDDSSLWEGKLIRLSESIDPIRDTLGMVVRVEKPYEGIIPGKKPPLLKGMYTSVEFLSPLRPALVLPRKAVHQGRVYVVSEDDTLKIQPIKVSFTQGNLVIVDEQGRQDLLGKRVIVSEVVPVVEGMRLNPRDSVKDQRVLTRRALGEQN